MRARTCVSVVVCVVRKLRPCPSYSGRRDRNNSVQWRSLYKGGGASRPNMRTNLFPWPINEVKIVENATKTQSD